MERISDKTPTPCPDEDTYGPVFQQGILPPEQIADIARTQRRMRKRCGPSWSAQFGKLYGAAGLDAGRACPHAAGRAVQGPLLLAELAGWWRYHAGPPRSSCCRPRCA
jgi:hypothetical protein